MDYISTRDTAAKPVTAAEAICRGLAPDGGLYVPQHFPAYAPQPWHGGDYQRLARDIFALYLTDFNAEELAQIVAQAYGGTNFPAQVAPLVSAGAVEVLELFHGPTSAFKDMALQALPRLLTRALPKTGAEHEVVILVATSGDTGKAALEGFKDVPGCRIIAFYPAGGVSKIQELQMLTTGGDNTAVVAVTGNFDDCQSGVKQMFGDAALNARLAAAGKQFSSANSINFGRLLPQIVYYYHGYGQMVAKGRIRPGEAIQIVVPTGNFGNILAAYYAKRMGLPVARLLCASNQNDVLTEAIQSGCYNRMRPFYQTDSPSMDILVSSNFERFLFEMYGRDAAACAADLAALQEKGSFQIRETARAHWRDLLAACSADDALGARMIKQVFAAHGYLLDPHTAIGWAAWQAEGGTWPTLLAATASPYKFPAAVLQALGEEMGGVDEQQLLLRLEALSGMPIPQPLRALQDLPVRAQRRAEKTEMAQVVAELLGLA